MLHLLQQEPRGCLTSEVLEAVCSAAVNRRTCFRCKAVADVDVSLSHVRKLVFMGKDYIVIVGSFP